MTTDAPDLKTLPFEGLSEWKGKELGVSRWLTVDQELVDRYADLTGDRNWIHVDRERAQREMGGTIAHGLLVLSLMPEMRKDIFRLIGAGRSLNYGYDRLRFTGPTPTGSRIRLKLKVVEVTAQGSAQRVTFAVEIEREGAERPVLVADWIVLLHPKAARGEGASN